MLTRENTRALVEGPAPKKEGPTMRIKILSNVFIQGEYAGTGAIVEAPENDAKELILMGEAIEAPKEKKTQKKPAKKAAAKTAPKKAKTKSKAPAEKDEKTEPAKK